MNCLISCLACQANHTFFSNIRNFTAADFCAFFAEKLRLHCTVYEFFLNGLTLSLSGFWISNYATLIFQNCYFHGFLQTSFIIQILFKNIICNSFVEVIFLLCRSWEMNLRKFSWTFVRLRNLQFCLGPFETCWLENVH